MKVVVGRLILIEIPSISNNIFILYENYYYPHAMNRYYRKCLKFYIRTLRST